MKARYVDLPYEKLAHRLHWPERWEPKRGRVINIDPVPFPDRSISPHSKNPCVEPHFRVIGEFSPDGLFSLACAHLIDLDESALDAEVEAIAHEVAEQAAACIPDQKNVVA